MLQARENLMETIQDFLKEYDHIPPKEKCMALLLAEKRTLKIKQAMEEDQNQPEVMQELLLKLMNGLQILKGIQPKQAKQEEQEAKMRPFHKVCVQKCKSVDISLEDGVASKSHVALGSRMLQGCFASRVLGGKKVHASVLSYGDFWKFCCSYIINVAKSIVSAAKCLIEDGGLLSRIAVSLYSDLCIRQSYIEVKVFTTAKEFAAYYYGDMFKENLKAKALPTNDARVVVKFLKSLFARFGTPRAIISDRGTHFCNDKFAKVMSKYGVTHRLATAYHLQTSGQVEVSNRGLKRILERTVGENCISWSDKLDDAQWAFRTAFKTPIGCTPYKLVYGKSCHLPIELEHKAYWALKHANFDLKTAGDHRKLQLNELRDQAYKNSLI
ncbi:reverse transcriptase domain-containing protein [Tanacetum coccineum]